MSILKEIINQHNKGILYDLIPSIDLPVYGNSFTNPKDQIFQEKIEVIKRIEILKINGKWLINGNPYNEISYAEKIFFDEFILSMKLNK